MCSMGRTKFEASNGCDTIQDARSCDPLLTQKRQAEMILCLPFYFYSDAFVVQASSKSILPKATSVRITRTRMVSPNSQLLPVSGSDKRTPSTSTG